jgi:hypothetical protein
MRHPIRRSSSAALFALLAAFGTYGARGKKPVNTSVDEAPPHPRLVVVAAHSWAGSSQALVVGALDLLSASPLFEEKRSEILWYDDPDRNGRHHVIGAYSFLSAAPVAKILAFLRGLEQRFDDRQVPDAARLLQTDLLWVEGARVDAPGLKLPSAKILGTYWGVNALMSAASDWFVAACEEHREDPALCHAVQKESDRDNTTVYETPVDTWIGGRFQDAVVECWAHAHARDEEIVAASVDALLTADAARARLEARAPDDLRRLVAAASEAVTSRKAEDIFPLEVAASGTIDERVLSWVNAVSAKSFDERILARRGVVFALEPGRIRGAIVGTRLTGTLAAARLAPVSSVQVIEGGGAPGEPRAFSVTVRMAAKLPK